LQEAKDLGLQGQRHIANLVQEQRAAADLFELADAAAVGPGEGGPSRGRTTRSPRAALGWRRS
jgi:hypothetical protein